MLAGCTPYPEEFGRLYREKGYWADLTLGEVLDVSIKKYGPKEALIYGDLRITYNLLGEKVDRLASHFLNLGLKPLDIVVFQLANTVEHVFTFLALIKIGVIPVMALPAHRFTEINHFVQYSGAVATFTPTVVRKFEKITHIAAAVPLISRWASSPVPQRYDLSSLKVIQNGGARLAPELRRHIVEQFKCIPQEVFGTGEGLLCLVPLDADEDMIMNSSGKPISPGDEIKVMDDKGNEVPDGQQGELIVRGPYTIRGYYNAPETNKTAFTADGYYYMGDIVRKNERGYVFTEGRKKDLINRGGEKISCEEVENFILANPKVENVCLVAMPDEVFGEKGCAFVLLKPGEAMDFKELIDFLKKQNIASFKLPERLEVVSAFPLSPAGKILKRKLRDDITEKLKSEKASSK
ncbi:MAG: 2,3-dihydroxybenzoate-AMP ligase [Pelotomaculum sp. PtaB.Bin104]|nr:MAG: 2,3-dihydroxybenzoate-AMP ligase [Pelotomaculum sp. PtaB.Bin104]